MKSYTFTLEIPREAYWLLPYKIGAKGSKHDQLNSFDYSNNFRHKEITATKEKMQMNRIGVSEANMKIPNKKALY